MKFWKEHTALRVSLIALLFIAGLALAVGGWSMTGQMSGLIIMIVGLVLLLAAILVGRRAAGNPAIPFNGRTVLAYVVGIAGALVLGVGMCLTMVWGPGLMIPGILVGCVGLLVCVLNMALRLAKGA